MDDNGTICQWVVVKLKEGDPAGSIADLTLCIEGKIKLVLNGVVNLSEKMRGSFDPETF